jgi:4-hydroxybenzoate polyprenyltransferase
VVAVMSAVLFFLLGAAIFSLGESKQIAVFFLVLALVAAAGVIYLRWRASDDNRPQGPAPGAVC